MADYLRTATTELPVRRVRPIRMPRLGPGDWIVYAALSFGALIVLLPFIWMLSASFKPTNEILVYPPQLIPSHWTADNYAYVLFQTQYLNYVKNSLIVVIFTISGHVISGSLVAYGFSRFRFPGRNILFIMVLGTLMIPFQAYMIPRFWIMKQLGVLDSLVAVFLPYLFGGPLYIFLLRQFFMGVPQELDDAAKIDGCNSFQVFTKILFPLIRPAVVTVAVLEFVAGWTSFLEPLLYLNSQQNYTVALGLSLLHNEFAGIVQWGPLMAATTLTALPPLILFFIAQKQLLGGISTMGVKG